MNGYYADRTDMENLDKALKNKDIASNIDLFASTIGPETLNTYEGQEALKVVTENQKKRVAAEELQGVYEYGKGLKSLQSGLLGAPKQFTPNDPWYEKYQQQRMELESPVVSSDPLKAKVKSIEEGLSRLDEMVPRKRFIHDYDSLKVAVPGWNTLGQEEVVSQIGMLRPEASAEEIKKAAPVQAHMSKEELFKRQREENLNTRSENKIASSERMQKNQLTYEQSALSQKQALEKAILANKDLNDATKNQIDTRMKNADRYDEQAKALSEKINDVMFAGNKDSAEKELELLKQKAESERSTVRSLLGVQATNIGVGDKPAVTEKPVSKPASTTKPLAAPKKAPEATGDPKLPQGQSYGERRNTNTGVVHKVILDNVTGKVVKVLGPK